MKISKRVLLLAGLLSGSTMAFLPALQPNAISLTMRAIDLAVSGGTEDCECASTMSIAFSGKPSESARTVNHRQAVREHTILTVNGDSVTMDDLIGAPTSDRTSVVVFLRSLGWPLCQEFILQWSQRIDELKKMGVTLVMVSIGKPEVGKQLIDHLELQNADHYLFVDPENVLYTSLELNSGVKETLFSIETPLAFLERFTKDDGMKELTKVLSKWSKATFIPPKQEQNFNQGGTFIFDGDQTVFAHYDASTGAHSNIEEVLKFAKQRTSSRTEQLTS